MLVFFYGSLVSNMVTWHTVWHLVNNVTLIIYRNIVPFISQG